ncbi:MAG: hypothetical protein PVF50_08110 [Gammaproteobacteria bacterium]|jgi:hypothetical protein
MRHLLNFLHFGKRARKNPADASRARSSKRNPSSTLIIAGEPVPRADEPAVAGEAPTAANGDKGAPSQRLADVIKSRRRDRWNPPELDGPEFGGLIERRGVDTRGLMPQKYEPDPVEEHRYHQTSKHDKKAAPPKDANDSGGDTSLESTGVFLASLDNSAITLADSGLFKIADEPEEEPDSSENFDPYDHRR